MIDNKSPRAQLQVELPPDRYRIEQPNGHKPQIGDVLELDQAFTGQNGEAMILAYCRDRDGRYVYEAEVYESELGPPLNHDQ